MLTFTTALTVAGFAAVGAAVWSFASATTEAHDRVSLLQQRFSILSGSTESGQAAFTQLVQTSNTLGVSLEDSGQAFSRFIVAGKDIGLTTKEAGLLADTTLKLGRIGGATTQEMTGGMIQLGQALAANRLGGDEFRSVMENLPLVARAIAKEMGVNVGALKDVAAEGKITADVIANALFGAMKDVDKQFKELPQTASAMAQQIQNEWTLLLSDLDSVFGGSSLVKNVYGFFRDAVKGARDMIAPSDDQRVTDLESEIAKRRKNIEDRNNSFWKSPAFDDQDRQAIERAQAELDGIRKRQADAAQKEREGGLQAGLQRELNLRQKHQQAVDQIAEGADPLVKATKERDTSLASLKSALDAGAISEERYKTVVGAVNDQYDAAVDRVNKRNNALTVEERAINSVTDSYSNLLLHIEHAQLATKEFQEGGFTKIDVRANERVVDFLTSFAKQAKISGASLQELADLAGISLDKLRADFRKLEVEQTKQKALERVRELGFETDETKRLAEATLQGATATSEMSKAIEVERTIREMGLDAKDKDLDALRAEVRAKLEAAEAAREYLKAAQEGQNILERYGDGATRLRLGLEKLNETQRILTENGKMTPEMQEAFSRAAQDLAKQTKTVEGAFYRAFDDIGDAWEDLFDKMILGGKVGFRDFANSLKDIFTKALAEMAYIAPMKPVSVNIAPLIQCEEEIV